MCKFCTGLMQKKSYTVILVRRHADIAPGLTAVEKRQNCTLSHFPIYIFTIRSLCLCLGHSHHSLAPKPLFHPTTAFPGALLQAAAILGQMASAAFFGIFSKPTLVRCFQCGRTRSVIMMNCRADGPLHTNAFCGRPKKRLFGLE